MIQYGTAPAPQSPGPIASDWASMRGMGAGGPVALYNAKPAPIHSGDLDAAGFSTEFLTSTGYAWIVAAIKGGSPSSGALAGASHTTPAAAPQGFGSWLVGLTVIGLVAWWLDREARR